MHTINGMAILSDVDRSTCGRQCLPVILWPLPSLMLKASIMSTVSDLISMMDVVSEIFNLLNVQDSIFQDQDGRRLYIPRYLGVFE